VRLVVTMETRKHFPSQKETACCLREAEDSTASKLYNWLIFPLILGIAISAVFSSGLF
jgi:hypothetical protein